MIGPMEKSSLLKFNCATRSGSFTQISLWIAQLYCSVTRITLMPEDLQWFLSKTFVNHRPWWVWQKHFCWKIGKIWPVATELQTTCDSRPDLSEQWNSKEKGGGKDGENIVREQERSIRAQNVGKIWVNGSDVSPVHPVLIPIDWQAITH